MVITDTPGTVFDKIALDVIGPLPKTRNGYEYILTMQDQLSKFCLAVPLKDTLVTTITNVFVYSEPLELYSPIRVKIF